MGPWHVKYPFFYQNVQGLIPFGDLGDPDPKLHNDKLHDLNRHIARTKPDVVILNESWLKSSIHDSEIFASDNYKIFRLDRCNFTHPADPNDPKKFRRNGGGVLLGLRRDLDIESKVIPVKCHAEILAVELTDSSGRKVIISTFYRTKTLGRENHELVSKHMRVIRRRRKVDEFIMIGDMNFPNTDWDTFSSTNPTERLFLDTFNDLSLTQLVLEPTHIKGNTLDYILTDKPENVSCIQVDSYSGLCGADHFPINFKLKLNARRKKATKRTIPNFNKADFASMDSDFFDENWNEHFSNVSV